MTITLPLWLISILALLILVVLAAIVYLWIYLARAWGNGRISW